MKNKMANLILHLFIFLTFIIYFATGSLVHLGDIEGKSFYEESSVYLNWTEAFSYCLENGMRLAKVESKNQSDFLTSSVNDLDEYWVSSKTIGDPQSAVDYSWDNQGANITLSVIWTDSPDVNIVSYCAFLYTVSVEIGIEFLYYHCGSRYPFTLCEIGANATKKASRTVTKHKIHKNLVTNKHTMVHHNLNFTHVGDVEDKAFYLHHTNRVNWTEAHEFCQEANMSLAKIESQVQANFLYEKVEDGDLPTYFWIGVKAIDLYFSQSTFNMTGSFLRDAYGWASDGRAEERDRCGFYSIDLDWKKPIVAFPGCYTDQYFLCHVSL